MTSAPTALGTVENILFWVITLHHSFSPADSAGMPGNLTEKNKKTAVTSDREFAQTNIVHCIYVFLSRSRPVKNIFTPN